MRRSNQGVIPKELVPHLFEPREARRAGAKALGLGLYVCRQIALAHGGELEVESAGGGGTRFTLVLPRQAAAAPAGA